jgi:cbb3-type cytochrome oxidase maturation protein
LASVFRQGAGGVSVIYLLMPLAFALGGTAVWAFVRATRAGQFDDLETPAHRILHDDEPNTPDS